MACMLFDGDDSRYLQWLHENSDGYVINMRRRFDPGYVVLHRAACSSIRRYPRMDKYPGGFTERAYLKLCGSSIAELESYLVTVADGSYSISSACSWCEAV